MTRQFKLLAVLAHPDDESLGFGGTLARYSAEGVETYLVTATPSIPRCPAAMKRAAWRN